MEVLLVLLPFVLIGLGVLFVAFSGGPAAARETYLTRGSRAFTVTMLVLYIGLGVAVPAAVIANREQAEGGVGQLRTAELSAAEERGKDLVVENCASCHSLAAVNARGVTGPNLDEVGAMTEARVLGAIRNGGTGQGRMPAELLEGQDARDVAAYVSKVAGQ